MLLVTAILVSPPAGEAATGEVTAGIVVDQPSIALGDLAREPRLEGDSALYVAWTIRAEDPFEPDAADAVREVGATPWLRVEISVSPPLADHLNELEDELRGLAAVAGNLGDDAVVQAVWSPQGASVTDWAYLVKRAAVAVTGAAPGARFTAGPLALEPASLRALYEEDVAAYLDLVALAPGAGLEPAVEVLGVLDPGKPLAVDALPWPPELPRAVAKLAESAATGAAVVLFDARKASSLDTTVFRIAARELSGNAVLDPYSAPTGAEAAWSFVREDLGLRVVVQAPAAADRVRLVFADPALSSPDRVDLTSGDVVPILSARRSANGLELTIDNPGAVELLRLERLSPEEIDGFGGEIDIAGGRDIPVEEILRRLQAFEDDQDRRLRHFEAQRALHLRFQAAQGSVEATYSGEFFFERDVGFDWVWRDFKVDGVRWRSKRPPELPLIQPEKVASLPTEIRLSKDYLYRLRGSATVDGRDCWVIDFKPFDPTPGEDLFRGTVWVDRERFARVRMRVVQVGLEGAVLSNEEIYDYDPVDDAGRPSTWSEASFVLPLKIFGQQNLSLLSITLPVELDTVITDVRINTDDFEANRQAALASDATMLRDTEAGLRYLRKDKQGNRFVERELDTNRLFVVGGVFWDDSVDFPIPLVGVNYLDLDFRDSRSQLNVFFAGPLLTASYANPSLFGSRWNGGATLGGRFFELTDRLYRDGEIVAAEDVTSRNASARIYAGRPLAEFLTFDLGYRVQQVNYDRSDDTAADFVLPSDTLVHTVSAELQYNRGGYRLGLAVDSNHRARWDPWGLPDNDEYRPEQSDYLRWQATLNKTWWLSNFRSIGLSLEHLDGRDLDRFSGYDFGIFGDSTVAGYPSGLVRAERASGAHVSAGINYYDVIRFELEGDAVWASNPATGLDNELLAGVGVGGTLTLPWQLAVNFEIGFAVAGPADGKLATRIVFLKLFPGS